MKTSTEISNESEVVTSTTKKAGSAKGSKKDTAKSGAKTKKTPPKPDKAESPELSESKDSSNELKVSENVAEQENNKMSFKDIDIHQYVTVKNGFHGRLCYESKHTGEVFVWSEYGEDQDMELRELKDAKNSNKKMFINNYFMFDEDWVIDYLGVGQYYKNSIKIDEFDSIFSMDPEDIKSIVSKMPDGQKRSVAYRAIELGVDAIDSYKVVAAIEEATGVELIEK